jgi:hypothetical protein
MRVEIARRTLAVALVGELGIRDGGPAGQAAQESLLCRIGRCLQACRDQRIDRGVDPADEKADRHRAQ